MENSILSNGALMRKTRIPYYIFPMSAFCTSVVNFLFSLVAFALVLLFTGTPVSVHVAAFPLVLLEMFAFSFGLGLFLAQANVFIRDVNYLYAVFITGWMYLTPLFYPLTSLPEIMQYLITYLILPAITWTSPGPFSSIMSGRTARCCCAEPWRRWCFWSLGWSAMAGPRTS